MKERERKRSSSGGRNGQVLCRKYSISLETGAAKIAARLRDRMFSLTRAASEWRPDGSPGLSLARTGHSKAEKNGGGKTGNRRRGMGALLSISGSKKPR